MPTSDNDRQLTAAIVTHPIEEEAGRQDDGTADSAWITFYVSYYAMVEFVNPHGPPSSVLICPRR